MKENCEVRVSLLKINLSPGNSYYLSFKTFSFQPKCFASLSSHTHLLVLCVPEKRNQVIVNLCSHLEVILSLVK